ncbi:hypothetical protein Droror1_Dr00019130 [Drosera rotundifolia]
MSCPHVAGAAAYVKSLHPEWSPSAIKSAFMITEKHKDAEFAYGSGHLDPVAVADPGLVYESSEADFIEFLCNMGYNGEKIKLISGHNYTCPREEGDVLSTRHLNYPSMAGSVSPQKQFKVEFGRTVTNLGSVDSIVYSAGIIADINITVEPETLSFNQLKEKKTFVVSGNSDGVKDRKTTSLHLLQLCGPMAFTM